MPARSVIIVSPYFPPSMLAGVHRARHLAKHLPAAGWHPIVLCVDEACHEQRLDPGLAALVPADAEVVKVGALPARLTRLAGIGEISVRAWYPLRHALFALLAARPIGAVLITGSPYFPMLLAGPVRRRFGVPVVLDFQDPWVSAWGAGQPSWSKSGLSHRLARALEPRALRDADFVTSVSETQNAELAARYRWVDAERLSAIPIGGDPDDFAALRSASSEAETAEVLDPTFVNISYVGAFWPRAEAVMRAVLRAFARLRSAEPAAASRIRLNFIGTGSTGRPEAAGPISVLARMENVVDGVREFPSRVAYLRALAIMARSDAILMVGSDEPHYTASKIYPVLMCGRPFISLYHRASSAHAILSAAGGGQAFGFDEPQQLPQIEGRIAEALRTLAFRPDSYGRPDPGVYKPYEAQNIARRFAAIFDRVADGCAG